MLNDGSVKTEVGRPETEDGRPPKIITLNVARDQIQIFYSRGYS